MLVQQALDPLSHLRSHTHTHTPMYETFFMVAKRQNIFGSFYCEQNLSIQGWPKFLYIVDYCTTDKKNVLELSALYYVRSSFTAHVLEGMWLIQCWPSLYKTLKNHSAKHPPSVCGANTGSGVHPQAWATPAWA